MKLPELEKLSDELLSGVPEDVFERNWTQDAIQCLNDLPVFCATFREMLDVLKQASEATAYVSHDDSVGYRVCCQVVSYKPHTKDCGLMAVIKKAEEML